MVMDQIANKAAKYPFMSGGKGNVPLVFRAQGGAGNGFDGEHSQSLETFYYHVSGLKVGKPSTPYDAEGLLKTANRSDDPVIFIEHKLFYLTEGDVPEEKYLLLFGEAGINVRDRILN